MLFLVMALALMVSFPVVSISQEAEKQEAVTPEAAKPETVKPEAAVQEAVKPEAVEPETEKEALYAYGVVTEIGENSITVEEVSYDAATGEEVTKKETYEIAPEAELENITSVKDIKASDEVDIEYTEKDGKKVASYVYRYVAEGVEE